VAVGFWCVREMPQGNEEWRLHPLPPCSEANATCPPPTRLEGIYHLITFKGMLSSYVVGSACVGYLMAPGEFNTKDFLLTTTGTAFTVLSANAWNQIYESESDSRMHRTSRRYLPSGGCHKTAIGFAVVTGVIGGVILWRYVNPLASTLAVSNIALYGAIYTPLKQMHWINTWIGSIVGAIPPMIGWAGKTGGMEPGSWVLGGLLFFWQMPHFMSIAWKNQEDYERGGYKMLVNTNKEQVPGVAFRYSLPLLLLGPLSYGSGITSKWFMVSAFIPSAFAVAAAYPFWQQPTMENARKLFLSSLITLPTFCILLVAHRVDHTKGFDFISSFARGLPNRVIDNVRSLLTG